MSSLIPGFEYDIFISYRQKDNKGDRWVSEFVEALKIELESAFKEEISIYFDINPSDYLLETYDVDASLKKKLKCLIFIPIISRTYCDPKSFAWDHEFKAFIELASRDQFGLKVALPNSNVATRVLPVRIHDLDAEDMRLFESVTGGFPRGVEFIYKEPGVNRPLKPDDDEKINLNRTKYRNQINKVALAVKDIIESMKVIITHGQGKDKEVHVKEKKGEKDIKIEEPVGKEIVNIGQGVGIEKTEPEKESGFRLLRKSGILIPGLLATIIILGGLIYILNRHSKIKWTKGKAMSEIEQFIMKEDITAAFNLVQKAEKYISKEPKFKELSSMVMSDLTVITDPPGADVYIREYSDVDGEWKKIGKTPVDSARIRGSSFWQASLVYLVRIMKPGYEDILTVISSSDHTLDRKLFKNGSIPPGMIYVECKNGFFIDRFEVSNAQYKEFVDDGGYSNPVYWKNEFRKEGKTISRDEAMNLLVDKTGRPSPSAWEAGDYPDGHDNYPVSGICWYEAAAYAGYAGKSLPTSDDWGTAIGDKNMVSSKIIPFSNFSNQGPEPSGKLPSVTRYGACDMAGNVREWCWNDTQIGHIIRGGAWNDASYMSYDLSQLPSFDRSPKNGFRCVQYIEKEKLPESAFQRIEFNQGVDFSKVKPMEDNIFMIYKNQFLYDKTELNVKVENKDISNDDWTLEKITFNSAYGKERVFAYLFLPENSSPPYQTLIFFPGTGATREKDLIKSTETKWRIDYLLKSGRAVMCPVYKGTFERIDEQEPVDVKGHQAMEWITKWAKDFSRSIDYLETRSDIDISRIGYYGCSLGGLMGGIIPAVEDRLKVNILILGGFYGNGEMVSFVSRITIPTLMLNGKYDGTFPYETSVLPFYNFIGTPLKDKQIYLYDTDHYVPKNEMIKEVLTWCDKYLGPVKFKNQ